ncbi:MAG: carbon-nitrogen family hydrolase [Actinomycetes bacterium]
MKVAVIQHNIEWADRDANFRDLSILIADAVAVGAQFIVLTEMFSTGFVVDRDDIGEPLDGPSSQFLSTMAKEHNVWVAGSCPEISDDDARPFNSLVVASPHGIENRYNKIHPFTYGGEHNHFRAGDSHQSVTAHGVRISLSVCYDLRFADEYWAQAHNTDLYIVPANWPASRREHWMALLKARAIENQAYVIGCNRVGDGGGLHYAGDSMIINPLGEVLAMGADSQTILFADIDPEVVLTTRTKFPFLQDRR